MSRFPAMTFELPDWIDRLIDPERRYPGVDEQMDLVIDLSRRNVELGTGGPFGAAVFEQESGRLVAPGVNLVVPSSSAIAHAEIVAVALAGVATGGFDLGRPDLPRMVLVASTEPCAMCFGAVPWSGVSGLICGARDEDARAVGFDEGPKVADWEAALIERGIRVTRDIRRPEARAVLEAYAASGGTIYNGRRAG
jgi:tRNA(Arg) A34 adenosine deaminase TadA